MSKFRLLIVATLVAKISFSQNTFPTNGNVGINTTNPSAKLDVNGNMKVDSCLIVKDSVIIDKDLRTKGKFRVEDEAFFLQAVYLNDKLIVGTNIEVGEKIDAVGNITSDNNIKAGNNVRAENNVVADNNVNVGNKLNVTGNTNLDGAVKMNGIPAVNNLNNPNLEVVLRSPSGALKTMTLTDFIAGLVADKADLEECTPEYSADPYWMSKPEVLYTVCSNVFCGLGTSNPQHKLHVIGTTYSNKILAGNGQGSTDAMINGYVQGTAAPIVKLGQKTGALQESVRFVLNNKGDLIMTNIGDQPSLTLNNGSGHALVINDNNGNKILQLENGGLLRSRHVRVNQDNWADYVFDDCYELMPLNEVEKYIDKHGHLPNTPSADEVNSEGQDLGELQNMQMEKIEELFLYVIELEKKVVALEAEVESLK